MTTRKRHCDLEDADFPLSEFDEHGHHTTHGPFSKCSYEDAYFLDTEFAADGEHLGRVPRHLITGDLKGGKPSNTPLGVAMEENA